MLLRHVLPALLLLSVGACIGAPTAPDAMRLREEPEALGGVPLVVPDSARRLGHFDGLAGHDARGSVTVEFRENGIAIIAFGADFAASHVPDPHLYLNTEGNPNRGLPLRFSRLDSFNGAQRYIVQLPANAPAYTHVLLWCDRYNQGVGAARIRQ